MGQNHRKSYIMAQVDQALAPRGFSHPPALKGWVTYGLIHYFPI